MKTHYKNTHKELLQQRQDQAQKLIAQKATPSISCHFCRKRTKDWKAHLHKCTALWQCAIMCAQHQDARAGYGGLLRGLSGYGCDGSGHGTIGTTTQSLLCSQQAPQGALRIVSTDTLIFPGRLPRSLSTRTTSTSAQPSQRSLSVYFGQGSTQAAGGTSGSAPGLGLHPLHEAGETSVMSHLYQTALNFKAKLEADPQWQVGQLPLRMVLTVALFKELTDRLNQTLASQERLKKVTDQGWRSETGWRFQRWNPTLKHLEVDTAKAPIPDDKLLDQLATILQCLKHPIVNRFRRKRKLTETMTTQATFVLDVSMRGPSSTALWEALRLLQNNAVLQLIGTSYKTEGLGRSNMEQHIRNLMYG